MLRSQSANAGIAAAGLAVILFSMAFDAFAQGETRGVLEEITVTAQFKAQALQATPLAISAFSGENLEARSLTDVTQIDAMVPNTVFAPLGAGYGSTVAAFIRGIGLGDNSLSFEPGVPTKIYFNDAIGSQVGYSLVNARLTWVSPDEAWSASLAGTNLTDEEYFHGKLSLTGVLGREQGNIAAPREWSFSVRRKF